MEQPFLRAYAQLLIETCHRRGVHAMGGMAAQIPIKDDAGANERGARQGARRQAARGAATATTAPGSRTRASSPIAREIFDAHMPAPNQIDARSARTCRSTRDDLLRAARGHAHRGRACATTSASACSTSRRGCAGSGCVPLYDLMEDAATAEISRAQVWQWIRHGAALDDGRIVTAELVEGALADEMCALRSRLGDERFAASRFQAAARLFESLCTDRELADFLTLPAYEALVARP